MYVAVIWYVEDPYSMSVYGPYAAPTDAEAAARKVATEDPSETEYLIRRLDVV